MFWNEPVVATAAAALLAGIMAGAALHKALDLVAFRETLRSYALVPVPLLRPLGLGLPVAEIASAGLLLVPVTRSIGAGIAASLLLVYSAALARNLARGRTEIACGCSWGGGGQGLSGWLLVRNGALGLVAGAAAAGPAATEVGFTGLLLALLAAATLLVAYHAADRLIANWSGLRALSESA